MTLPYQLIRSRRRSISISLDSQSNLTVRAPIFLGRTAIENFIASKTAWIEKHRKQQLSRPARPDHQFLVGEFFSYLGQKYPLSILPTQKRPLLFDGQIFSLKDPNIGREAFNQWYKKQAKKIIAARAFQFSQIFGLRYQKLKITTATSRWGSCTIQGTINFNWKLAMAPMAIIDYVIYHELAHLQHHNHSQQFWQLVEKMYPNHRVAKKWLKENGHTLTI